MTSDKRERICKSIKNKILYPLEFINDRNRNNRKVHITKVDLDKNGMEFEDIEDKKISDKNYT